MLQHRGMDVIIAQDLANLRIILSWLSYVDLGFDLAGVMQVRHCMMPSPQHVAELH